MSALLGGASPLSCTASAELLAQINLYSSAAQNASVCLLLFLIPLLFRLLFNSCILMDCSSTMAALLILRQHWSAVFAAASIDQLIFFSSLKSRLEANSFSLDANFIA